MDLNKLGNKPPAINYKNVHVTTVRLSPNYSNLIPKLLSNGKHFIQKYAYNSKLIFQEIIVHQLSLFTRKVMKLVLLAKT